MVYDVLTCGLRCISLWFSIFLCPYCPLSMLICYIVHASLKPVILSNPTKLQNFYLFAPLSCQFVSQLRMVIKSRKSPVYRLCESDSDAMKFMSQLFGVFTNSVSSLLLGSNHSAPRLLRGALTSEARSRLEYG